MILPLLPTGINVLTRAPDSGRIVHKCDMCELPAFHIANGMIILRARHHGETHTTVISIAELYRKYVAPQEVSQVAPPMDFFGGVGL